MTSDERLMQQSLNALVGVLELAATRDVKPTDVTQTIVSKLRERLAKVVGAHESVRLNTDRTVAVDSCYHWRLIATDPPPRAAKVQLVNRAFGVATYGTWYPGSTWTHWAPLPTFAPEGADGVMGTLEDKP